MRLQCLRCRRTIEPGDRMVVVTTGRPYRWADHVLKRLEVAPRWHWQCAPKVIRAYAPVFTEDEEGEGPMKNLVIAVVTMLALSGCAVLDGIGRGLAASGPAVSRMAPAPHPMPAVQPLPAPRYVR